MHHVLTWPVGRNEISKRKAPLAPLAAYAAASSLAAAAIGLAVGLLGVPARANPTLATALVVAGLLVMAVAAVSETRGTMHPFAQPRRQVPRRWLLWRHRTLTGAAFGAMIGSGVLTYTEHAVAYALGVALLLSPSVSTAVVLGRALRAGAQRTGRDHVVVRSVGLATPGVGEARARPAGGPAGADRNRCRRGSHGRSIDLRGG
jgi:hypothetical protein